MTKVKLTVRINQDGDISFKWYPETPIPDQTTFEVLDALIKKREEDVKDARNQNFPRR